MLFSICKFVNPKGSIADNFFMKMKLNLKQTASLHLFATAVIACLFVAGCAEEEISLELENAEMTDEQIAAAVAQFAPQLVVLTGGEPGLQVSERLVDLLHTEGRKVAIETNGTCPLPTGIDWVTVSPKEGSTPVLTAANEVKVVFQAGTDVEKWHNQISAGHYFLQPCSCKNTSETVAYIMAHPHWRLSLQTHKYLGIR